METGKNTTAFEPVAQSTPSVCRIPFRQTCATWTATAQVNVGLTPSITPKIVGGVVAVENFCGGGCSGLLMVTLIVNQRYNRSEYGTS